MTTPTTTPEAAFDLDSIFDQAGSGGSGAPSYKWPEDANRRPVIGSVIQGEITDVFVTVVKDAKTREPKLNKRNAQMPQVNITLQTSLRNWEGCKSIPVDEETNQPKAASEDTGERRIYAKFIMLEGIAKAIKDSPQGKGGPRVGAKLAVRVTGLKDVGELNPLVEYDAKYVPPVADPAATTFDTLNVEGVPAGPAAQQHLAAAPAAADPWASAPTAPASSGGWSDEPPF